MTMMKHVTTDSGRHVLEEEMTITKNINGD